MAEGLPPPTEQPPASSSSSTQSSNFWQLISGVANDLDLMLHDLFPDASLLAGAAISPDDPLLSHASILEQLASSTAREEVETDRLSRGGSSNPPSPAPPTPPPCPDPGAEPPEPSPTSSSLPETTATTATTSEEESTAGGCEMGLLERLIRTHPVWFLPSLGRAGATHLLQGREVGCFIVRSSSKPGTMALSVRLPLGAGPHVEHYLLESAGNEGQIRLEGSQHQFHAIPTLVCHYCQCCDELPAQLCLPPPLMEASSRQELSSLALLGQDYWLSSMVNNSPSQALPPVPPGHTIPPITNKNSFKTASLTDLSTSTSPPPIPLAPKPRPTPPPPPPPRVRPPPAPSEDEPDPLTSTPKKLHYKKSNIIKDGYFASSLADKISDYEDIWHSPSGPQQCTEDGRQSSLPRAMVSQETQTEILEEKVENNSSLFYSEPIDSVASNPKMDKTAPLYRFSDPSLNGSSSMKTSLNGETNDAGGVSISSSFENLSLSKSHRSLGGDTSWLQELKSKIRGKAKESNGTLKEESLPPSAANTLNTTMNRRNWTLDSSWEWLGNEDSDEEGSATVHEIIVRTSPELQVLNAPPRLSDYDNLEEDESGTEISEPWDLAQHWESLLKQAGSDTLKTKNKFQQVGESDTESVVSEDSRTFQERLEPLLAAQRVVALRSKGTHVGENIRNYVFRLAEEDNTFAKSIENFIQCTKESMESNPTVTMRNIRQFMTGMKNYLVKHGEGQFEQMVQQERSKLKADEFLNIDAILEGALHRLVIKPLKTYIYQLFVSCHSQSGALRQLSDAIKFARARTPQQLGIRQGVSLPSGRELELVGRFLSRLQRSYSPLRKLENLLAAIAAIYSFLASSSGHTSDSHPSGTDEDMRDSLLPRDPGTGDRVSCGAEEFMPVFMWSVARCGLLGAEIEADYMWALLHPSLLAGEAGYYLAALSSAVQVLKALPAPSNQHHFSSLSPSSTLTTLACGPSTEAFLKVLIPDELTGSLLTKTLPIRLNMTTRDVGKMIAHKFRITNPQDYGLFRLVKGEEIQLQELECPHQLAPEGGMFAYKRCDARFVWPVLPDH